MSKFTPGPWVLVSEKDCFEEYVVDTRGYYAISQNPEIQIHDPIPPDRFMDAYLIAAAPELLAACEAALANMIDMADTSPNDMKVREQLTTAINEARGE